MRPHGPGAPPLPAGLPRRGFVGGVAALAAAPFAGGCADTAKRAPRRGDRAREARWAAEFEPAVVVGETLRLRQADGHAFAVVQAWTPGQTRAVVLVHGIGVHPDHGLTQALRTSLHDRGYATLALQAPVLDPALVDDGGAYAGLLDEAAERVELTVAHARSRGARAVFLVGHTMGAWMVSEYFARRPAAGVAGWAALGMTGRYSSFGEHRPATLDLYPERGSAWTRTMAPLRRWDAQRVDPRSRQVYVGGTDLSFAGEEARVGRLVADFFDTLR